MAHQVEHSSSSEASDYLKVEGDASLAYSGEGPSEPSEWSSSISDLPSSSESDDDVSSSPYTFCQCKDENTLLEYSACGSFLELDTHCPGCQMIWDLIRLLGSFDSCVDGRGLQGLKLNEIWFGISL